MNNKPLTREDFLAFYPQFTPLPNMVIEEYVRLANSCIDENIWLEWIDEGRRLFAAHKCTLFVKTSDLYHGTMEEALSAGLDTGNITSQSVGGVSVSYSPDQAVQDLGGFGDLKTTAFGLQLATYAKKLTLGTYVP